LAVREVAVLNSARGRIADTGAAGVASLAGRVVFFRFLSGAAGTSGADPMRGTRCGTSPVCGPRSS
jgi:hypothetical protein